MRKRNCRYEIRFTEEELNELTQKARSAGLSNAAFVRKAIQGLEVKEAPPADVPQLLNQMRRVGYNLDQTLKHANATGVLDVPQFRKDLEDIRETVREVRAAYYTSAG